MITRYQNLIRLHYWQKVVNKNQKVVTQSQKFITKKQKNKGDYSVSEPHQNSLLKKIGNENQKVVTQNQKFITKKQRIEVITRYQNLIRFITDKKSLTKTKKW